MYGVVINQRKHSTGIPNQAAVQNVDTTYVVHHIRIQYLACSPEY